MHIILLADDSKMMSTLEDKLLSQTELNKLVNWANTWLMELNLDKCKLLHFGKHSPASNLTMLNRATEERVALEISSSERDLGIQVSNDLKWKTQCAHAASKGNRVLGMLSRAFVCKDAVMWRTLYTALVRPHLEFAAPVLNPDFGGDLLAIEKVQRRATCIIRSLRKLLYDDRCNALSITDLCTRRARGDLIQVYKIRAR